MTRYLYTSATKLRFRRRTPGDYHAIVNTTLDHEPVLVEVQLQRQLPRAPRPTVYSGAVSPLQHTDPDEPEFGFFYLGDLSKQRTDYDPSWDYVPLTPEVIEDLNYLVPDLVYAYQTVVEAAARLRLPEPLVYLADLTAADDVAKYIYGTTQVLLVDFLQHEGAPPDELELSLLHELAHAWLDSTGEHEQLDHGQEEDAAEDFARRYTDDPEAAVERLQAVGAAEPREASRARDHEYREAATFRRGAWYRPDLSMWHGALGLYGHIDPDDNSDSAWDKAQEIYKVFADLPEPIPVWRVVHCSSGDECNVEWAGVHWSFSREAAIKFSKQLHKPVYLLSGVLPSDAIDWDYTMENYLEYPEECEVTSNDVTDITLVERVAAYNSVAARDHDSEYEDVGFTPTGRWGNEGSGILFTTGERILLLHRSPDVEEPSTWGIPGGAVPEDPMTGETKDVLTSALDETEEELGWSPAGFEIIDQYVYQEPGFRYVTFICRVDGSAVDQRFRLNWENDSWLWVAEDELSQLDLHFGVVDVLRTKKVFD